MKHLIVINPKAGNSKDVAKNALEAFKGLDFEIYETVSPRSVINYLREYLIKHAHETVRVYACGGDGTINEVVNGMVGAPNAELAIYACGTGNDFVKIYGGAKKFLDFKTLINGTPKIVDLSKVSGETLDKDMYSINVINFGFDAIVGATGNENKLKGKPNPYGFKNAIVPAILHGRFNKGSIYADGENLNGKKYLLGSLAQGQFIGGEYHASPKSDNTDGLIDVIVAKPMSFIRLMAQLFSKYHDGKHLDDKRILKRLYYRRAKEVEFICPKETIVCVDGEIIKGKRFKIDSVPAAIKVVIPE